MIKKICISVVSSLGFWRIFRFFNRNKLTILLYHGIAPQKKQGIYNYRGKFISPNAFRNQLQFLKKYYKILPLDEAIEKMYDNTLPPYSVTITFDDGYRNFYTHAFPPLKEFGFTATFFIATDFVIKKKPLWVDRLEFLALPNDVEIRSQMKALDNSEKEKLLTELENKSSSKFEDFLNERSVYAPLSIEEMKEMQAGGMSFGAHTQSHPILTKIPENYLQEEMAGSKRILEEYLGKISSIFCYPNGQSNNFNDSVIKAVKDAGFSGALTTIEGCNDKKTDPYKLGRIVMDNVYTMSKAKMVIAGARIWFSSFIR